MQLNLVYELVRVWINHWEPVLKLTGKKRVGAKVTKHYDQAQTPYRRVLVSGVVGEKLVRLGREHGLWGPSALRQELDQAIEQLWSLSRRATATQRVACG